MDQDDRWAGAVVLIVEIDGSGVFLTDGDRAHETPPDSVPMCREM
jgi:hypothetical protein